MNTLSDFGEQQFLICPPRPVQTETIGREYRKQASDNQKEEFLPPSHRRGKAFPHREKGLPSKRERLSPLKGKVFSRREKRRITSGEEKSRAGNVERTEQAVLPEQHKGLFEIGL